MNNNYNNHYTTVNIYNGSAEMNYINYITPLYYNVLRRVVEHGTST